MTGSGIGGRYGPVVAEPEPDEQPSGPAYLRLILLGAAIGVPAALVAALFLAVVHTVEDWLWEDLPQWLGASSPPWYLIIGLPVVVRLSYWPSAPSYPVATLRARHGGVTRRPSFGVGHLA